MSYDLLVWNAWARNATPAEIAEKLTQQQAEIVRLREAVKALGDCIKATCKKHKMEVATLAILNNPIAAAAVREAGR